MRRYSYKALNAAGQPIEGNLEVNNETELDNFFKNNELRPLKIVEGKATAQNADGTAAAVAKGWWREIDKFLRGRVPENDLIAFTRQFGAAYGAGLSVPRTLDMLARQTRHPYFKEALLEIAAKIESGQGLTDSFDGFRFAFDKTYLAILRSGEVTGNLDVVLNYCANLLEKKLLHKERLKSTFLYPKLVAGMLGIASIAIVMFVIPQFAKIYDRFEAELPLPTQILMAVSKFSQSYWWAIVALSPVLVWFKHYLSKNSAFMLWFDERTLGLPILGETFRKIELTHFCTTFALLMRAGIRVTEAASISIESLNNTFLQHRLGQVVPAVEQGSTISGALDQIDVVPPLMASMISVGEESGALDGLLDRVAALYENETEMTLKKMPTLLEPVILSILFVLVLGLALAVYLPMWKMASLIKR